VAANTLPTSTFSSLAEKALRLALVYGHQPRFDSPQPIMPVTEDLTELVVQIINAKYKS